MKPTTGRIVHYTVPENCSVGNRDLHPAKQGQVLPLMIVTARDDNSVDGHVFRVDEFGTAWGAGIPWSGGPAKDGCWSWPERA